MTDKDMLISILTQQSNLLDKILSEQDKIHDCVSKRSWTELENSLNTVSLLTDDFVALDSKREDVSAADERLCKDPQVSECLFSVRTKLSKSKIENQALSAYVNASKKFISGVLDRCIPQQRNTLYTPAGYVKKPGANSVVINTVF